MGDFFILAAMVGIGFGGGYIVAQTEGATLLEKVQNFFGIRRPPAR
jgi:hypothetical protein